MVQYDGLLQGNTLIESGCNDKNMLPNNGKKKKKVI